MRRENSVPGRLRESRHRPSGPERLRKAAFTLIELLIVTSALAVTSMAVYAVFSSGLKIWREAAKQLPEEDLAIFIDKFTTDLRNSFKFEGMNFTGTRSAVEFATLVNSQRLNSRSAGKIRYFYDNHTDKLSREIRDFSHISTDDHGRIQGLVGNVKSVKFGYYYYDKPTKEYVWKDEAPEDEKALPLAVRIELGFNAGGRTGNYVRTINIPVGGYEKEPNVQ
ncbi:MAG: prepilin-type N-terminal cleavage/methylation domain-containing protein [Candidatus Omnitrophota bacterium]